MFQRSCCLYLQGRCMWSWWYIHCTVAYPEKFLMHNSKFSWWRTEVVDFWALHYAVKWLETNILEVLLLPSSGFIFVMKEMYPLHCCLPREFPCNYVVGSHVAPSSRLMLKQFVNWQWATGRGTLHKKVCWLCVNLQVWLMFMVSASYVCGTVWRSHSH
jgi:hypothetical protein